MALFRGWWLAGMAGLMLLPGCGGGGGTRSPAAPAPSVGVFEGAWGGSLTSAITHTTLSVRALILASGELRYVASDGTQATGTLVPVGTATASAMGTLYALPGQVFTSTGGPTAPFTLAVNAISGFAGWTLYGTYAGAGDSGTFSINRDASANYESAVVMANMAGAYASLQTSSGTPIIGSVGPAGTFQGSDGLGTLVGTLTPVDVTRNAFRVTAMYTPTGLGALSYAGLAYFSPMAAPVRLYVQATGPSGQFATELGRTGP